MNIKKLTVEEMEDYLLTSSPIFGLPNFKDILRIHVTGSYYKVMSKIIEKSVRDLDRKCPILMRSNIFMGSSGVYEFTDNLDLYLKGELPFNSLTLLPTSIINLGGSLIHAARTFRLHHNVLESRAMTGRILCEYLARHPVRFSKHPTEDEFTEDSMVYGISYMTDYQSDMFLELLTYNLVTYIIELRSQVNYTELPIEIFSGLVEKKSELNEVVNEFFLSPTLYGELWR